MDPTTPAAVDPLQALTALAMPVIVGLLKMASIKLPKRLIPLIVIVGGVALQFADSYLRGVPFDPSVAIALAAAAIGVREANDQPVRTTSAQASAPPRARGEPFATPPARPRAP